MYTGYTIPTYYDSLMAKLICATVSEGSAQRSLAPAERDLHRFFSIPADALERRIAALGEASCARRSARACQRRSPT